MVQYTVMVTIASINVISLLFRFCISFLIMSNYVKLNCNRVNATTGNIIHVSRDRHISHKRTLLEQSNIVLDALLQVSKGEEREVVDVFAEVLADLGADVCVGEGEHTTVGLAG